MAVTVACSDRRALERHADAPPSQWLAGTWDVRFTLDRSPVLSSSPGTGRRTVRGRLAILPNRSLDASYPSIDTPTDYGTFDIDFTPFGFDVRDWSQTPVAVAGWRGEDSVAILLNPEQGQGGVTLRGKRVSDSIIGDWEISLSRSSGGGGRFLMVRHRER